MSSLRFDLRVPPMNFGGDCDVTNCRVAHSQFTTEHVRDALRLSTWNGENLGFPGSFSGTFRFPAKHFHGSDHGSGAGVGSINELQIEAMIFL